MCNVVPSILKRVILLPFAFSIFACSHVPKLTNELNHNNDLPLFQDKLILKGNSKNIKIENENILGLDGALKQQLDKYIKPIPNKYKRIEALQKYVLQNIAIGETYRELKTKTAMQTFQSKTANCLSYANLFIASARYVGLEVDYHLVHVPPSWIQENNAWVLNHHINVLSALDKPQTSTIYFYNLNNVRANYDLNFERKKYLFDINTSFETGLYRGSKISDSKAHAYFYANMAAEALIDNDLEIAYLYTKKSIQTDPSTSNSWNTLGIIYGRIDQFELAEQAYLRSHKENSDELSALSNLHRLYTKHGYHRQAKGISKKISLYKQKNPYYHYLQGQLSYKKAEYKNAIKHINNAIKFKQDDPRFHYIKAQSYLQLGKLKKAEDSIQNALHYTLPENRKRYYGKYEYIKSLKDDKKDAL